MVPNRRFSARLFEEILSEDINQLIDQLVLPPQNARVEAILATGGRREREAIYELTHGSSESSGDEWVPVRRVTRDSSRA